MNLGSLDKLFDEPPPHSLEAEMALLGAMIYEPSVIPDVSAAIPGPEAFFSEINATMYREVVSAYEQNGTLNMVLLQDRLRESKHLDRVGGIAYAEKLISETPGPATVGHFCKIVLDRHHRRMLLEAAGRLAYDAMRDTEADPPEIAGRASTALTLATQASGGMIVTMGEAMLQVIAKSQSGAGSYLKTGFEGFDQTFGGLEHPGVVVVMGTPGTGKTTWLVQILTHMARMGTRTLLFSNEQPPIRVAATTLSAGIGESAHKIMGEGRATVTQIKAMQEVHAELGSIPFEMVRESMNAHKIFAHARLAKARGVKVVAVDYLQRLPSLPGFGDGEERVGESMDALARIARDLDMTVVIVSQLSKGVGQRKERPTMFSGAWSGRIENAADQMFALYREHMHEIQADGKSDAQHKDDVEQTECLALKVKYGPMGVIDFTFDRSRLAFMEGGRSANTIPFD